MSQGIFISIHRYHLQKASDHEGLEELDVPPVCPQFRSQYREAGNRANTPCGGTQWGHKAGILSVHLSFIPAGSGGYFCAFKCNNNNKRFWSEVFLKLFCWMHLGRWITRIPGSQGKAPKHLSYFKYIYAYIYIYLFPYFWLVLLGVFMVWKEGRKLWGFLVLTLTLIIEQHLEWRFLYGDCSVGISFYTSSWAFTFVYVNNCGLHFLPVAVHLGVFPQGSPSKGLFGEN